MPTQRPLRAVTASDKPKATPKPKTVTQAAKAGTRRELLVAMRDRVAQDVENPNTSSRDLAALTKRLMELVHDIEAVDLRALQEAEENAAKVQDGDFDASAV